MAALNIHIIGLNSTEEQLVKENINYFITLYKYKYSDEKAIKKAVEDGLARSLISFKRLGKDVDLYNVSINNENISITMRYI